MARLFHSAELLGLTVPATQDQVVELVHEGIKRNAHLPELYIKMTVTGTAHHVRQLFCSRT